MSIPRNVHVAVEASRLAGDCVINEDIGRLVVVGRLSRDALSRWQLVYDQRPVWLTILCVDESGDTIAPKDVRDEGERIRLTLNFDPIENAAYIFTVEGLRAFLVNDSLVSNTSIVRLAFADDSFATKGFLVASWVDAPAAAGPVSEAPAANPRRYVRSQSPDFMPPSRIAPWISKGKANSENVAWREWERMAKEMIARALPNELYIDTGARRVALSGQPPRSLDFGAIDEGCTLESLQEAADWVYLDGSDIEVRHTFLTAELAREWPTDASFCQEIGHRLTLALESARLLYKAHLRSGSKDTLKALADLRKSLADDVQKTIQQARDLSNAIWRDVALAIGVLAVRLAMDPAKATATSNAFAIVFFAVAIYVAASFWIATSTNNRFFKEFDNTTKSWRPKLYAFLDNGDYNSLAETPVAGAISVYRSTERKTTVVVFLTVLVLVFMASLEAGLLSLDDVKGLPATAWTKAISTWHVFVPQSHK